MPNTRTNAFWYNFPSGPTYYEFFDDFDVDHLTTGLTGSSSATGWLVAGWDLDVDTGTVVTTTPTDGVNGTVVLSTTAADNKWAQIQRNTECFALTAGKKTDFLVRLQHSIALTDVWVAGLFLQDEAILDTTGGTTGVAVNMAVSDGVFFCSPEADAGVYGCILRDSVMVGITGPLLTMSNATNATLSFTVDMDAATPGKGSVTFFVNGQAVGSILTSLTMPYSAEETLAPAVALIARSATGSTLTVDYVGARGER